MPKTTTALPCPHCRAKTEVLSTREHEWGVRRTRQCSQGHRFTTNETTRLTTQAGFAALQNAWFSTTGAAR